VGSVRVHIKARGPRPACIDCATRAAVKDRARMELVDLPCFGPARLVWHKVRWRCLSPDCPTLSWTEVADWIAAPRLVLTDRAGRWAWEQVGRHGRSVNEVAVELGCDCTP
jgi:transposase